VKERFQKIYSENADSVFRYCFFRVSDRILATDLTQDIFMRYWDNLAKGTHIGNDRAFLFTVARNIIIDWYRKKKSVSLEGLQEENEDTEEFTIIEDNAKGALDMQNESRFLLDKIKALPATSQQILYLRYIEDLKPKEIAQALDIKENTVSVRIHRALDELRKITGYELT
jgi:RNA polymerase sigma-70 factor (ECF subfamily)